MKHKKKTIKANEARMLQSLHKTPRSLTINQLARKSNISWATTDKYLRKWKSKGLVKPVKIRSFSTKLNKPIMKPAWVIHRNTINRIRTIRTQTSPQLKNFGKRKSSRAQLNALAKGRKILQQKRKK